ncbi:hypothetical protein [Marinobacter sp. JSM 1782161]|nr:hypothetical protein [Marinobacter sp. JSM 1782161]
MTPTYEISTDPVANYETMAEDQRAEDEQRDRYSNKLTVRNGEIVEVDCE